MTTRHDRALQLAAMAIDWPLAGDEAAELDEHLRSCPACRSATTAIRHQATILRARPRAIEPSGMGDRIALTWQSAPMTNGLESALRLVVLVLLILLVVAVVAVGAGAFPPDRLATVHRVPLPEVQIPAPRQAVGEYPQIGAPAVFHIPVGDVSGECSLLVESDCSTDALFAFGSLWATSRHGIERVEPSSGASLDTIDVGGDPIRMIATDDALWVTVSSGSLVRIDPNGPRVVGSVPVGRLPGGLAWYAGAIWVADAATKSIVRVDPVAMEAHGGVDLGIAPVSVAKTPDAIWVSDRYAQHLIRIDTSSMSVAASHDVPGSTPVSSWDYGEGVVASGDRVYVASGEGVARFDPASDRFTSTVAPVFPHLAPTPDALWLVSRDSKVLQRLDPDSLEVQAQQLMDLTAYRSGADWEVSIATSDIGFIWLNSYRDGLIRVTLD
jgi:hypothetical protein